MLFRSQLTWGGLALHLSFVLTGYFSPFANHFMNQLELLCLVALIMTVVFGFHFLLSKGSNAWVTVALIVMNSGVFFLLLGLCVARLRAALAFVEGYLPERWRWTKSGGSSDDTILRRDTTAADGLKGEEELREVLLRNEYVP